MVDRVLPEPERARRRSELKDLPKLSPFIDQVFDAEKIAIGAYSPLEGFADSETIRSICTTTCLPNGLPWAIPIVLTTRGKADSATISGLKPGDDLALLDTTGRFFALLHLEEIFPFDAKEVAAGAYGTTDPSHPNVADLYQLGTTGLAGKVDLLERLPGPGGEIEPTPDDVRAEFARRGWSNVAGYQTRNVPHTAHEYLQRCTLERSDVDGLFIHPVVGRLKKGDYKSEVILDAYRTLVQHYYPADRVYLSPLNMTMRYAGPKGALFFAIIRKNYGCGLYIVGRDQAGVGKFYDPFACHRIFDEFPIGIIPLLYEATYYCRKCGWMASPKTCAHSAEWHVDTSQTRIRAALSTGENLPTEIIRPEIAEILRRGDVLLVE
jgi:sulfate adenylyltransferase